MKTRISTLTSALIVSAFAFSSTAYAGADVEAAKALAKQNNCMKCHGIDKDKDGPAFKKTAGKYKGKADGEAKLVEHLTSGPKVKLPDGTEEEHKVIKTTPAKDIPQIKNLVQYILEQ
jgi:cytochrome c